jgi:hypothetical protein
MGLWVLSKEVMWEDSVTIHRETLTEYTMFKGVSATVCLTVLFHKTG